MDSIHIETRQPFMKSGLRCCWCCVFYYWRSLLVAFLNFLIIVRFCRFLGYAIGRDLKRTSWLLKQPCWIYKIGFMLEFIQFAAG